MNGTTKVYPNGNIITEVTNREEHLCSEVYRLTNRVGTVVSDEELPDCTPTQHEVSGE